MKFSLQNRSLQIVILLGLYFFFAPFLPYSLHQGLYTFSLFIKDCLLWLLPITVCFFLAHSISSFEKKAPLFLLSLFLFEAFSNSCCVWYAYGCSHLVEGVIPVMTSDSTTSSFLPLWRLPQALPSWWTADKGTFAGILLGLAASFCFPKLRHSIQKGKSLAERVLTRFFAKLIPLFILGFVARMKETHLLEQFSSYANLFLWLIVFLACYICFLFLVGNRFSLTTTFRSLRNLLPATGVAFSSGCSLSTMPWTIEGSRKNLKNPELAQAIIPATTNIQQVGDCIAQAFCCSLLIYYFKGTLPTLETWIAFSSIFVLARFATAAVIGGAIFIMLPIYESYLEFTPEMIAMILTFNVLLDPVITASNVIGNGGLCHIFERVWLFVLKILKTKKIPSCEG